MFDPSYATVSLSWLTMYKYKLSNSAVKSWYFRYYILLKILYIGPYKDTIYSYRYYRYLSVNLITIELYVRACILYKRRINLTYKTCLSKIIPLCIISNKTHKIIQSKNVTRIKISNNRVTPKVFNKLWHISIINIVN